MKEKFPIFKTYPNLVYLDNAATSQKPDAVINALSDFYTKYNSNVHRGLYPLSEESTRIYEEARTKIANLIGADSKEIIFTSGTTEGLNGLARSLQKSGLLPMNPKIMLSDLEHHSNILPWQGIDGVEINYLEIDKNYEIQMPNGNFIPDLASFTHVSNVTGSILHLEVLKELKKLNPNIIIVLDCAQSIAHMPIDVKELDVDFIVFSGHKMYGPMGIGVLYGKQAMLEKLEPFNVGGGMIRDVNRQSATWAEIPEKFEAGTPSVADAYALGVAVNFINEIGFEEINKIEEEVRNYAIKKLTEIDKITVFHPSNNASGVISFSIDGIHPHDITQALGEKEICLRAGHHCTQILHREVFDVSATSRLSLAIYNSLEDIDKLIEALKKIIPIYSKN